jgi:myo-inositol-1(or 4)-monophosphatase
MHSDAMTPGGDRCCAMHKEDMIRLVREQRMKARGGAEWESFLGFAEQLADAAAAAILPHFRTRPAMENKPAVDFDPVTEADRGAERAMRALIEERYPDHGILGEEYGPKPARSAFTWVLDPIDGTRSFVCGATSWTTLIGLRHGATPVVGLMNQPYVEERFLGSPLGSFLRNRGGLRRLAVSPAPRLAESIGTTTAPHLYRSPRQAGFLAAIRERLRFMRYDGDAYFFCLLAAGQIDIALDAGLAPYDIAPLVPIIEGAGGIVTTWDGGSAAEGGDIIAAASPALYEEARALIPAA